MFNNHNLTAEDVVRIRKLYETGDYTQEELARKFKCSQNSITLIVNYKTFNKLDPNGHPLVRKTLSTEQKNEIYDRLQSGENMAQIARDFDVTRQTISAMKRRWFKNEIDFDNKISIESRRKCEEVLKKYM